MTRRLYVITFFIPLIIIIVVFLVNHSVVKSTERMSTLESLVNPLWDKNTHDSGFYETLATFKHDNLFMNKLAEAQMWSKDYDFSPDIIFEFDGITNSAPMTVIAWKNLHAAEFFILYYHSKTRKIMYEFSRGFAEDKSLSTASDRNSTFLPQPPGSYKQVFEKANMDELYAKHMDSLALLEQNQLVSPHQGELPINTMFLFISTSKKQLAFLKTIPYWKFKGVYWYFVRRNALVNKPISV